MVFMITSLQLTKFTLTHQNPPPVVRQAREGEGEGEGGRERGRKTKSTVCVEELTFRGSKML